MKLGYRDKAGVQPYKELLQKYNLIEVDPVTNGNSVEKILADLYGNNILPMTLFSFDLDFQNKEYEVNIALTSPVLFFISDASKLSFLLCSPSIDTASTVSWDDKSYKIWNHGIQDRNDGIIESCLSKNWIRKNYS